MNWSLKTKSKSFVVLKLNIFTLKLQNSTEILQVIAKDVTSEHVEKQKSVRYMVQMSRMNDQLELLSHTDEMTGLFNFRSFKEKLLEEHNRSVRFGLPYSILFCDLDQFKHYNDRNGHPAGDVLLKQLAAIFLSATRNTDVVTRYGGEEFVVICSGTDETGAYVLAERLRSKIENHPFPFAENQPLGKITISIGVSTYPRDGKTPEEVVQVADQAVYVSKNTGRNRVTLSKDIHKL
jgi:diguanylate cyclase (GGDEF)-like protein